jgi:hypothetical protein
VYTWKACANSLSNRLIAQSSGDTEGLPLLVSLGLTRSAGHARRFRGLERWPCRDFLRGATPDDTD